MEWTCMATVEQTFPVVRPRYTGVLEWITTTDHKKIGALYLFTTFFFFLSGGLLALAIRTQLATPDGHVLTAQAYNAAFTTHGTWPSHVSTPSRTGCFCRAGSSCTRASSSVRPPRAGPPTSRCPRSRS